MTQVYVHLSLSGWSGREGPCPVPCRREAALQFPRLTFQRLHSQEQYPGTGIGLAIVKKAVEMLDGRVRVESTVGAGSRFFVELPLRVAIETGRQP